MDIHKNARLTAFGREHLVRALALMAAILGVAESVMVGRGAA